MRNNFSAARILKPSITAIGVAAACLAFPAVLQAQSATSSETVNPFNQYSASKEGVSPYSGDVYLPQTLYTLPGRNGMDVSIDLRYSSNVFLNVVARNDKSPTGWVGLGWRTKAGGSIRSEHNGTMSLEDDRFTYVSSEGVNERIIESAGKYFLEREPYWKVVPEKEGTNRITGWTLTDPSGKIFRFGDFVPHAGATALRNATRYLFSWEGSSNGNSNHVGEGFAGTPELYPVQWDLQQEIDLAGNVIKYEYQQTLELVKYKNWANTLQYTKASYLSRITNPEGATIEFLRRAKDAGELLDPKDYAPEPDVFMEFYEDQLLQKIQVRDTKGNLIREFEFCYQLLNTDGGIPKNYRKSLLRRIFERDGAATNLGKTEFEYYDDVAKRPSILAGTDDPIVPGDYNFGALKSVEGKSCGKTTFEYARKEIDIPNRIRLEMTTDPEMTVIRGGVIESGEEYIVAMSKQGELKVYNWVGGQWKPQDIYKKNGKDIALKFGKAIPLWYEVTNDRLQSSLIADQRYFVVVATTKLSPAGTQREGGLYLLPFIWDGTHWVESEVEENESCQEKVGGTIVHYCDEVHADFTGDSKVMAMTLFSHTNGYFIPWVSNLPNDCDWPRGAPWFSCTGSDPHYQHLLFPMDLWSYNVSGLKFKSYHITQDFAGGGVMGASANGNNFMIDYETAELPGNDRRTRIFSWNGTEWRKTLELQDRDRDDDHHLGRNYLAEVEEHGLGIVYHEANAWNWSGKDWSQTLSADYLDSWKVVSGDEDATTADIQASGEDYFVARYDDKDNLGIFQWNGDNWRQAVSTNIVDSDMDFFFEAFWRGHGANDFFVARYPRVYVSRLKIKTWWGTITIPYWKRIVANAKIRTYNFDRGWGSRDWGALDYPNTEKNLVTGQDIFIFKTNPATSQVWNGTQWLTEKRDRQLADEIYVISPHLFLELSGSSIYTHRKFQNSSVRKVYSFPVSRKIETDPITGASNTYTYTYESKGSMYDIPSGTAKFNKVTTTIPGHGSEVSYFFNDYEDAGEIRKADPNADQTLTPGFQDLDGRVYRRVFFDSKGVRTGEQLTSYSVFRGDALGWPRAVFLGRPERTQTTLDGVTTSIETVFEDGNGMPGKTIEVNSDGRKKITVFKYGIQVPAYQAGMDASGKNMLEVRVGKTIYENAIDPGTVQSATATTWEPGLGAAGTARFMHRTYKWKKPATGGFTEFTYPATPANPSADWVLTGTISKYSAAGNPIEFLGPSGTPISTIRGRSNTVSSADCAGAGVRQCAVFTGDYDENTGGMYDAANAWSKGGSVLSEQVAHYGKASVHIRNNQTGPSKTMGALADTRDFVFSAWVYPVSVGVANPVYLAVLNNGVPVLDNQGKFGTLLPGTTGGWQKVSRSIPGNLLGGTVEIRVSSSGNSDFYADDIRFQPKGSVVSTRYFHPKFLSQVAAVGSGDRAEYSEYDDAARVIETYREDAGRNKVLVSETDYANILGCSLGSVPTGKLAKVAVSQGVLDFNPDTHAYGNISVGSTIERISLEFNPQSQDEAVSTKVNGGEFQTDCCNTLRKMEVDLATGANNVAIKVGSGQEYSFTITRLATCWTTVGAPVSEPDFGGGASMAFQASVPYLAYKNPADGKLYVKKLQGSAWVNVGSALSDGESSWFTLKMHGTVPYVAFTEMRQITIGTGADIRTVTAAVAVVKKFGTTDWVAVGGLSGTADGVVSKGTASELSFDIDPAGGALWLAYVGDPAAEDDLSSAANKKEKRIYVRKLAGQNWDLAGGFLRGASPSLAVAGGGVPHIAYVGSFDVSVPATPSTPAVNTKIQSIIIKKLRIVAGAQVWGSIYDNALPGDDVTLGDFIESPGVNHVALAYDGSKLYLAYDHEYLIANPDDATEFTEGDESMLYVRVLDPETTGPDGSHWRLLSSGPLEEDARILRTDSKSDYTFSAVGGVPRILFANRNGEFRTTAIQFLPAAPGSFQGTWKSIGIPGFTQATESSRESNLALGVAQDGTLFGAYTGGEESGSRERKVSVVKYNPGCKDPTLSQVSVKRLDNSEIAFDIGFKQYYALYKAAVEFGVSDVRIAPTPNFCNDIGAISLRSQDVTLEAWTKSGSCSGITPFTFNLKEGGNEFEVWGLDAELKNSIRYVFSIYRKPNPIASSLAVETVPALGVSPAFTMGNLGPYTLPDVGFAQSTLGFTATFTPDLVVSVNNVSVGSGHVTPIGLDVGSNTITMTAWPTGGAPQTYTFRVKRLPEGGASDNITQSVLFMHPSQELYYLPVSKSADQHEIIVSENIGSIRILKTGDNGCATSANGAILSAQPLAFPLFGDATEFLIEKNCADGSTSAQLVTVRKTKGALKSIIVGHRQGTEPAGFYEFKDIEEAYSVIYSLVASEPGSQLPPLFQFYIVADAGEDIVGSPPVEFTKFTKSGAIIPTELIGVKKGSPVYQQLLSDFLQGVIP